MNILALPNQYCQQPDLTLAFFVAWAKQTPLPNYQVLLTDQLTSAKRATAPLGRERTNKPKD